MTPRGSLSLLPDMRKGVFLMYVVAVLRVSFVVAASLKKAELCEQSTHLELQEENSCYKWCHFCWPTSQYCRPSCYHDFVLRHHVEKLVAEEKKVTSTVPDIGSS
ncbi:hypothetical protein ACOMHN_025623 [Nucella lapillus]